MLYDLYLISTPSTFGRTVLQHEVVIADSRAEALKQRPADWPVRRTRASLLRRR